MRTAAASEFERFLRFAVVGGTGFVLDAGVLALLHHGVGLDPFSARLVSLCCAAFSTWRLNRIVTFGASRTSQATEGLRYFTVAAVTACFNYLVYAAMLLAFETLPPVIAAVIATLAAMSLSYLGYSRFVFQGSTSPTKLVSARSHSR